MLGNEDCGQMAAWYVFTAMGFYPVNPVSGQYLVGSPLFGAVTLKLANGKVFAVKAANASAANVYIQSATLDGKPLDQPVITWAAVHWGRLGTAKQAWDPTTPIPEGTEALLCQAWIRRP